MKSIQAVFLIIYLCCTSFLGDAQIDDAKRKRTRALVDSLYELANPNYEVCASTLASEYNSYPHEDTSTAYIYMCADLMYYYLVSGEIDSAIYFGQKVLEVPTITVSTKVSTYIDIGNSYFTQSKLDSALANYLKAQEVSNQNKFNDNLFAIYRGISSVAIQENQADKGIYFIKKALKVSQEEKDTSHIAECYYVLSAAYNSLKEYDKAHEAALNGLGWSKSNDNYRYEEIISRELGKILYDQNQFDSAHVYFLAAYEKAMEHGYLKDANSLHSDLAKTWAKQGNYEKAELHLDMAEQYYESKKGQLTASELSYLDVKADIYERAGRYREAYQALKSIRVLTDSLKEVEKSKHLASLITEYETELKENEIALLEEASARKDLEIKLDKKKNEEVKQIFTGAVLFLVLIGLILIRNNIVKKRHNKALEVVNEDLNASNMRILEQKDVLEKQSKQINESIETAQYMQEAIFPKLTEIKDFYQSAFVLYEPKDKVSGDFIWATCIEDEMLLCCADCTGHGVPGAFMSLIAATIIDKAVAQHGVRDLNKLLSTLNEEIYSSLRKSTSDLNSGMDVVFISKKQNQDLVKFAGTRNSILKIDQNSGVFEYKGERFDLGSGINHKTFKIQEIDLNQGDTLYLYTDGFEDQKGGTNGHKYYRQPFRDLLKENSRLQSAEQLVHLKNELSAWKGDFEQIDDITVIGLKF